MKTIVLVDDEALSREHFRESVPWAAWGYRIVGEASNGQEARELCAALQPDIALIDITMPVMDGLTLLRHLHEDQPDIRCIMLTAHRDFNYARQAIQRHACGYLLKAPLQLEEVKEALEQAARDVDRSQTLHQTRSAQQLLLHQYQYPLRKQYFDHILKGVLASSEEMVQSGLPIGIRLSEEQQCLLVCQVDQLEQYKERYPRQDDALLEFSMLEIVRETVQTLPSVRFELFPIVLGQFAVLLQLGENAPDDKNERTIVSEIARKWALPMQQYMDLQLTMAVSRPFVALHKLRGIYGQCLSLLPHRFYQREPRPVFEADVVPFHPWPNALFAKLRAEFEAIGQPSSLEAFEAWVLRARNAGQHWQPAPDRLLAWFAALGTAAHAASSPIDPAAAWPDFARMSHLNQALESLTLWARNRDRGSRAISVRPEIAKAVHFIKHRLREELTLDIIAREVQLSPSYLGQLFKKEVGSSIVDYIMEQRIDQAKRYLIGGDYRNYELADKVGFSNYSYFCTLFKKYTGMTPNQFRSSVRPQLPKD
ncbi:response regulator [Paenibacillus cymbidii]|uniref:response regulator n=1 Tax=Paenibacillus cymbidii TaxID=1639034 RepID=UPI0010812670|nr:response regulator [Paenibacillus cymbidii]